MEPFFDGINNILPPELFPGIFSKALDDSKSIDTFSAIRSVCKQWQATVDSLYLRNLALPPFCPVPFKSTTVSSFFQMQFHVQQSTPFPPSFLEGRKEKLLSLDFSQTIENDKLAYQGPYNTLYIFSKSQKKGLGTISLAQYPAITKLYPLKSGTILGETTAETERLLVYYFNKHTNQYEYVSLINWLINRLNTEDIGKLVDMQVQSIFTDSFSQTIYLQFLNLESKNYLHFEITDEVKHVKFDDQQHFILGKHGDRVFYKLQLPNGQSFAIKNSKTSSFQEFYPNMEKVELHYPFLIVEDKVVKKAKLLRVVNLELENITLEIDLKTLFKEAPKHPVQWFLCDHLLLFRCAGHFLVYHLFFNKAKKIPPIKIPQNSYITLSILGDSGSKYIKINYYKLDEGKWHAVYLIPKLLKEEIDPERSQPKNELKEKVITFLNKWTSFFIPK